MWNGRLRRGWLRAVPAELLPLPAELLSLSAPVLSVRLRHLLPDGRLLPVRLLLSLRAVG